MLKNILFFNPYFFPITATPPPTPENVTIVSSLNHTKYSVVSLQWAAIARSNVVYTINIAILGQAGSSKNTHSSNIDITLQYNEIYLLTLHAGNCVGLSEETTLRLNLVTCLKPSSPSGLVISPYTSTSEGAVISYKCMEGLMPNDIIQATCCENMKWDPDPMKMKCTSGKNWVASP